MKDELESAIGACVQELFKVTCDVELTRPDEQFGDYATSVALRLAKSVAKNPRQIAEELSQKIREKVAEKVANVSVAGPGFLNLRLADRALLESLRNQPSQSLAAKIVVAEYSDPNPFKVLHAGHVYTTVVGDAIANLAEAAGASVHRVNYGGDVGLHVGKTMWAILRQLGGENPAKLQDIPKADRANWLAAAYVEGTTAYDGDETVKEEIVALNKRVYQLHADNDHDSAFAQIYWTCRQWSYEAFDAFYARLGTKLEKYYPESEVADSGLRLVKEHIGDVFEESDGAVVFKGEPYGLHTRVFINREGIPTYETKEVGLIVHKKQDYNFDRSIIVTANEQEQYMAVVMKAIEQFMPELAAASTHVPHGMVKLAGGVKMSSRKGNIAPATEVLDVTGQAITESGRPAEDTTILGAIKYAFLKVRIGGDLVYEPKESVSLEGNSGPYLQYAHARARSILRRAAASAHSSGEQLRADAHVLIVRSSSVLTAHSESHTATEALNDIKLEAGERSLARKISEYAEVVDKAVAELMPHHVCGYLYELAQTFNRFYEHNRVIGDERQALRLELTKLYADKLRNGLELLGIPAPEKM